MTDARAAVGMDRLPWLSDEPKPTRDDRGGRDLLGWGVAAALVIAGASYWLGMQTGRGVEQEPTMLPTRHEPAATVKLPEPRTVTVTPEVRVAPTPEIRPAPIPTVSIPEPKVKKRTPSAARSKKLSPMELDKNELAKTIAKQSQSRKRAAPSKPVTRATPRQAVTARPQALRLWPSTESKGAYGRLVQIGAFGSRQQAKLGWRRMTRAYPAVGRLPAIVVSARNSHGRRFYRFQIGTTSQAHSEVLCQRMQRIRFSCAVVGLPWKAKVER